MCHQTFTPLLTRTIITAALLAGSVSMTGCFSTMASAGDGAGTSNNLGANVADVVTFPVQAPLLAALAYNKAEADARAADAKKIDALHQVLKQNPQIALDEKWASSGDKLKIYALQDSLAHDGAAYTPALLERTFYEAPGLRKFLFQNQSCPGDFIAAHYHEVLADSRKSGADVLEVLLANPRTPLSVLEQAYADVPERRADIFASPACTSPEFISAHFREVLATDRKPPAAALLWLIYNPHTPIDVLEQIYQAAPEFRENTFESAACNSSEYISRHFDELFGPQSHPSNLALYCVITNPATPVSVLERIVADEKTYSPGFREIATQLIKQKPGAAAPASSPASAAL